jgi:putative DNA primase/helicase
MSAAQKIASALGDARREGRDWRCRCPLHGGRSLVIGDGDNGCVLVTCWAGCERLDVLAEMRRRGLLERRADYAPQFVSARRHHDDAGRTARALNIWDYARPGAGTIVARYLESRGIVFVLWPSSLRFHPNCPRPKDREGNFLAPLPAMVALVEHVGRGPVAVHCTYLRPDGSAKAELPKKQQRSFFGPVAGGAVHFGAPRFGEWLAVAEGVETALSVAVACSMPAWAALCADGIRKLVLPPAASHVILCGDHDANATGERAARDAAGRWITDNRDVRLAFPPEPNTDFNDVLTGRATSQTIEARHVA